MRKDSRYENQLITVFSDYDAASGFSKTLSRDADDDEEFLVAGLTMDKYALVDIPTKNITCNSLDLRKHIPFDLNQMECSVSCTLCKSNSLYYCREHHRVYCSKHIANH
ncbi:hypothetical protein [Nitrosopumilus sp.]|uniref:hypothetical protein n=1 Tax=Nitrosopumilus sp. TaxID=2024843 RepID=UPI003B5A5DAB